MNYFVFMSGYDIKGFNNGSPIYSLIFSKSLYFSKLLFSSTKELVSESSDGQRSFALI